MLLRAITILILLSFGCSHTKKVSPVDERQILIRCHLFNMDGELLRQLLGRLCYLNDDGSYVATFLNQNIVLKYDRHMNVQWDREIHAHHHINKNSEGNYVLLSSEYTNYKGKPTRFDSFVILNKDNGKEMAKLSIVNHLDQVSNWPYYPQDGLYLFDWEKSHSHRADVEYSHYNSIHEVPVAVKIPGFPEINKGDYITGATYEAPVLFLDSRLKKIKATLVIPGVRMLHDVQVLENGNLLVYINTFRNDSPYYGKSMIAEYNIQEKKLINIYDKFYSDSTGGVQKLENGDYFFSYHTKTDAFATLVNSKGEVIKTITFPYFRNSPVIQQARIGNYSKNMELNPGP